MRLSGQDRMRLFRVLFGGLSGQASRINLIRTEAISHSETVTLPNVMKAGQTLILVG